MSSLDAKSTNAMEALAKKADDQSQSTLTGIADLERALLEKITRNTTVQDELSLTVASNHKHVVEITTQLETQTSDLRSEEVRRVGKSSSAHPHLILTPSSPDPQPILTSSSH